jgi:hypothetical protein
LDTDLRVAAAARGTRAGIGIGIGTAGDKVGWDLEGTEQPLWQSSFISETFFIFNLVIFFSF